MRSFLLGRKLDLVGAEEDLLHAAAEVQGPDVRVRSGRVLEEQSQLTVRVLERAWVRNPD